MLQITNISSVKTFLHRLSTIFDITFTIYTKMFLLLFHDIAPKFFFKVTQILYYWFLSLQNEV